MLPVKGIYKDGKISLSKKIKYNNPVEIIVTFLDDDISIETKDLSYNDFSFEKSQSVLDNYKGNICDILIEERRSYL